jgi:hypothetical protein
MNIMFRACRFRDEEVETFLIKVTANNSFLILERSNWDFIYFHQLKQQAVHAVANYVMVTTVLTLLYKVRLPAEAQL